MSEPHASALDTLRAWWAVLTGLVLGFGWLLRWAWTVNARLRDHETKHQVHSETLRLVQIDLKDRATQTDLRNAVTAVQQIGSDLRAELLYLRQRLDAKTDRKD